MATRLTREQLYAMVWDRPMTKLAAEFRLSDVALHKICRKHNVPTPPLGYWAKKAHDKPVRNTPLPTEHAAREIMIREGAASDESDAMAAARGKIRSALGERQQGGSGDARNPILERTLGKLAKAKPDRTGIAKVEGKGLIKVAVRPESVERATQLLEALVSGAEAAGILLKAGDGSAVWFVENETISFEVVDVADRIENVPTEAELKAVAKWEAQREADHRRYGYLRDWGRPKIPKWKDRYQGRLAVRLEEVKILSLDRYWGTAIRRVFADSKTQDVIKMIPKILSTIAAMAVAKRENREVEERRRLAEEEVARRRADAERRAAIEKRRVAALEQLMLEAAELERLRGFVDMLEQGGEPAPESRVAALMYWARERLVGREAHLGHEELEQRLNNAQLFGEDDSQNLWRPFT
jgi:hypothetical protein